MKKIYFRHIGVEVTRRCQLKCEHCMRGEAQDLDISNDIIDAFLEQTAGIGRVSFTGGEPTLAPDKMNYFVDRMIEKGIPLGGVSYITNGVELTDEVKAFLKKAYTYVTESRKKYEIFRSDCKIFFQPRIQIGLSIDNFHMGDEKVKREYERLLPYYGCDVRYMNNSIPTKVGRGKALRYGYSLRAAQVYDRMPQIGMEYESHHLLCDDSPRSEEMLKYCDGFIPCVLDLNAKGMLFTYEATLGEYNLDDYANQNVICRYENGELPSIFDSVIEYNRGRELCYITANTSRRITVDDLEAERRFEKLHSIDTTREAWSEDFDKIFMDDVAMAEYEISRSILAHSERYRSYLRGRIKRYCDVEEIKKDFPNANNHFFRELLDKLANNTVEDIIDWIVESKNCYWYFVEDKFFELTKSIYNQRVYSKIKKAQEMAMRDNDSELGKKVVRSIMQKKLREKLAK